jgi:hypothetical protein
MSFLFRLLDLSHCQLQRLGKTTFSRLEHLEVLHLHDNHFRRLDPNVIVPMRALKALTLERNPWTCDCRLSRSDSALTDSFYAQHT